MRGAMRKTKSFGLNPWGLALSGLLVALMCAVAGCGSSGPDNSTLSTFHIRKAQKPVRATGSGQLDLQDMVSAVATVRSTPAVDMKFALVQHADVGQPAELDVVVIPGNPLPENLIVSFQAAEGLDIVDGAQSEAVDKPVAGAPIRYVVKLVPKRDGIFTVTAAVTEDKASVTSTRLFAIPVIAGAGLSDAAPAAGPAAGPTTAPSPNPKASPKAGSRSDPKAGKGA